MLANTVPGHLSGGPGPRNSRQGQARESTHLTRHGEEPLRQVCGSLPLGPGPPLIVRLGIG